MNVEVRLVHIDFFGGDYDEWADACDAYIESVRMEEIDYLSDYQDHELERMGH